MSGFGFAARLRIVSVFWLVSLGVAVVAHAQDAPHRGRKYKAPAPTSHVEVTVVRATNGKPVDNAAVIFHPLVDGHDSGNMELKTDEDGKAVIDLLELGSNVRVQIIAPGFQTYGEDYKVDKDKMTIEVKLNRPAEQYSIYKKDEGAKGSADKPSPPATDAAPDSSNDPAAKDAPSDPKQDAPKADTKQDPQTK